MSETGGQKNTLSIFKKAEIVFSGRRNEAWQNTHFLQAFKDLSSELAGAYHVSDDIYSQKASLLRLDEGASLNKKIEFL